MWCVHACICACVCVSEWKLASVSEWVNEWVIRHSYFDYQTVKSPIYLIETVSILFSTFSLIETPLANKWVSGWERFHNIHVFGEIYDLGENWVSTVNRSGSRTRILKVYGLSEKKFIHQVLQSNRNKLNHHIVYGGNEGTWPLFLKCDLYEGLCIQPLQLFLCTWTIFSIT